MKRACVCVRVWVLLLTGCGGGGSESSAVPDGFETFDGQTFTFAHPAGWAGVAEGTTKGVQGPKGTGGLAPQAAVSSGQSPAVDFESIIAGYKADQLTRRANWEIVSEEPVEIDGAKEARMTEARYDEVTGGTTTPVRTIDLHVAHRGRHALRLPRARARRRLRQGPAARGPSTRFRIK